MNKVILMGRLTRDAEIRYSQGESATAIARFSLAVDRRFRRDGDDQNTDFINCVAFGRTAEFLERFGRKGTKFVLEGRIQTGSYTNKDGQRVYTTDVVAENVEFAESKNASGGGDNSGFNPSDRPSPSSAAGDGFMNIPDGIDEGFRGEWLHDAGGPDNGNASFDTEAGIEGAFGYFFSTGDGDGNENRIGLFGNMEAFKP